MIPAKKTSEIFGAGGAADTEDTRNKAENSPTTRRTLRRLSQDILSM